MSRRTAERCTELLALLGSMVGRPRVVPAPRKPSSFGFCKLCGSQVIWASMPSRKRAPLDVNPAGNLALVDGVALEAGAAHEGLKRFSLHVGETCKRMQKQ